MDGEFVRRVGVCLAKLHVSFSHLACSQAAAIVWAEAMDGISIEHVEGAVREYIRGETKTPTPAHIRLRAIANAKTAKMLAGAVEINGATYYTNPPDLAKIAARQAENRRYLDRLAASKPVAQSEPVRQTAEEFEARKQRSIAALKKIRDEVNGRMANEGSN